MLSRRVLRLKVVQALYAFQNSGETSVPKSQKELFLSIDRLYELYVMFLLLPAELISIAEERIEGNKAKQIRTEEDLNPNLRFVENGVFKKLSESSQVKSVVKKHGLGWALDRDDLKSLYNVLVEQDFYVEYMDADEHDFKEDAQFAVRFFKRFVAEQELLISIIQERSIYWDYDDIDIALSLVLKNLKDVDSGKDWKVLQKYKDEKEDTKFAKDLFALCVKHDKEYEELIAGQTKNWEVERIAHMDMLFMKMALTEVLNFQTIPVKVSLNEYIELSKWFSSPKSSMFINGILDKLVAALREENKIQKVGRGLIET